MVVFEWERDAHNLPGVINIPLPIVSVIQVPLGKKLKSTGL